MATSNFKHQVLDWEASLLRFAHQLTNDTKNAQDLYNRTIERALARERKLKKNTNLKSWLFTIMRGICAATYCKEAKRKNSIIIKEAEETLTAGRARKSTDYASIMNSTQHFINKLDKEAQEPFVLHYYGYKYQEIANLLNLPVQLIKEHITTVERELKLLYSKKSKDVLERTA